MENDYLSNDIKVLKGVGDKRALSLYALGIHTTAQILEYYPRAYEDRTIFKKIIECEHNETVCIKAVVTSAIRINRVRKNMTVYTLGVSDGTGRMDLVWFNIKFIENKFRIGDEYIFYGKVTTVPRRVMASPVFEKEGQNKQTGRILPVYPLGADLTQNILHRFINEALKDAGGQIPEILPKHIREKFTLCERNYAVSNIHFPASSKALAEARRRLVFEELFIFQTALFMLKESRTQKHSMPIKDAECVKEFILMLPFSLTSAQKRVIDEICTDMSKHIPMNRLVSGDVGCGKTIVAAAALYLAAKNGLQGAMMVPTEILANQHFENIKRLFAPHGITVELLLGSTTAKSKKDIYERVKNKETMVVIGTHALISHSIKFNNLGLVITDEQHRFGVNQRNLLSAKAESPHTIIMTATPIPRTMALIVYGDLEISAIDEMPPGRQKVDSYVVDYLMRRRIYDFIRREVLSGRQAYIVCPLVEESDKLNLKSVTEYAANLKNKIFTDLEVGFLHGKMKPAEKDSVMEKFISGKTNVLVATSVIEVGVDVPNASMMVIENAERFGLSQLHQLRGRVGRGKHKSYCILFNESNSELAQKRMETMKSISDGFKIAEVDLKLRGPGEFFGTRQHGLPIFKIADLYCDMDILALSSKAAKELINEDPRLKKEKNVALRLKIQSLFDSNVTFS